MSDLIDRQEAINALDGEITVTGRANAEAVRGYARLVADRLKRLPSAQPDIIRCKDCKYWIPYDWMFSEVWQSKNIADYPENEIGCKYCDMSMKANDFCSRGERREE